MSTETIIVERAQGAPQITGVRSATWDVPFEGDGPWEITPEEWAFVEAKEPRAFQPAKKSTKKSPAPAPVTEES